MRGGTVTGVVFHTDQGGEYTGDVFGRACRTAGVTQSMGRTGSALDNAVAESFNSTLEFELFPSNTSRPGSRPAGRSPGGSTSTTRCAGTRPTACSARSSSNAAGRGRRNGGRRMTTAMHRSDAPRRLRRRPSMLKGRCAIATRRPAAALDPGASAAPDRPTPRAGQMACPGGARRSLRSQDHINQSLYGFRGGPTERQRGGAGVPAGPGGWIRGGAERGSGFTCPDRVGFIGPVAVEPSLHSDPGRAAG